MKWLADENFRGSIVRGVLRRYPGFDILRVQDIPGIYGKSDALMLEWAASESRVVLTHDLFYDDSGNVRIIARNAFCPGIVLVPDSLAIGT